MAPAFVEYYLVRCKCVGAFAVVAYLQNGRLERPNATEII
jgi:hypothetical protein